MILEPDCCYRPSLRTLHLIDEAPDGEIVLDRCEHCRTYWRVTSHDRTDFEGADNNSFLWFGRLSDTEAQSLLAAQVA
jgi:hypothetical protein